MNNVSHRTRLAAVLTAAFIGLSATALAQTTVPTAPTPPTASAAQAQAGPGQGHAAEHHHRRVERRQLRMAERQALLKQNLQLAPSQEPAWQAFVARMQPAARTQQTGGRETWARLTTPQRLERMETMEAARDQAMAQRHDAIRGFYAQLTPAQQKTFDAQGMRGLQRTDMKGKHRHHHHGQRHGGQRM